MSIQRKLKALSKIFDTGKLWLTYTILGEQSLSFEELEELKKSRIFPYGMSMDFIEKSYFLGKLRASLSEADYKNLTDVDVDTAIAQTSLSLLEQRAIEHARLHAANHLKGLVDEIASGVYADLERALDSVITEATVRNIVGDETAIAIAEGKAVAEFASRLHTSLKAEYSRDWYRVAATELHSALIMGQAQTIINKEGIYASSAGIDSNVSIVPSTDTCLDCASHFLDNGNPKVFSLRQLFSAGSNGEFGVSHKRKNGKHIHWKTTLPPLHPNCSCKLVYMPPGTSWVNGKLVISQDLEYSDYISKAKTMSGPASLPGLPAPGNTAGPGRPKGMPGVEYEYRPADNGEPKGMGWEKTKDGGSYKRPKGMSNASSPEEMTENDKNMMAQAKVKEASVWGKNVKDHAKTLVHLKNGAISTIKPLTDSSHAFEAFKVSIDGNGNAIMKPPAEKETNMDKFRSGLGYVPQGTEHKREHAAYNLSLAMGLYDSIPPTSQRVHEGRNMSMQAWKEGHTSIHEHLVKKNVQSDKGLFQDFLDSVPAHKKQEVETKLKDIAVMDLVMNNNDRHINNFVVPESCDNIFAIDHGTSFGNGMSGTRNSILSSYHQARRPVKITPDLKAKLDNMTLGDYKRALSPAGMEDWEVGQAFLRSRYVSFLQDRDGHLDQHKFDTTVSNADNSFEAPFFGGSESMPTEEDYDVYNKRKERGHLPNQMFESWAKKYILDAKHNPDHKDHKVAQELDNVGVFMGPGFAVDHNKYRAEGRHRQYEDSIVPANPPFKVYGGKPLMEAPGSDVAATMTDRRAKPRGPDSTVNVKRRKS